MINEKIKFEHINDLKRCFRTTIVNMNIKQIENKILIYQFELHICWTYTKFDDFLYNWNNNKFWDKYLKHMLIFCQIYVQRNFRKKFEKIDVEFWIKWIWTIKIETKILTRMNNIINMNFKFESWIKHIKSSWILTKLNIKTSRVLYE